MPGGEGGQWRFGPGDGKEWLSSGIGLMGDSSDPNFAQQTQSGIDGAFLSKILGDLDDDKTLGLNF